MLTAGKLMEGQIIHRHPDAPQNPEISVILPIYCHNGSLLENAIKSVLNQSFTNFELIIVDDGSRDGSYETALKYATKDPRVVVIRHELNCGLPALRVDEGILLAKGTYIAYQFDDDEYLPNCLSDLYREISAHDEPCAVYGQTKLEIESPTGEKSERIIGDAFNYALLCNSNQIGNNTVLHHKKIFEKSGMYDPHIVIRRLSDYDLWRRMGKYVEFYCIEKQVSVVHAGQAGSLGASVPIYSMPLLRRYLEIDRDDRLCPNRISEYSFSDLKDYSLEFSLEEIEWLYRREVNPFLDRSLYLLTLPQKKTYHLIKNSIKKIIVYKSDYSTSIDVTIKNFLQRCTGLPYSFTFCKASDSGIFKDYPSDVNVFYRSISQQEKALLDSSKRPAAYWIDDNMFRFYEDGEEFSYLAPGTQNYNTLEYMVRECDQVVSYNPVITKDCQPYNKHVFELQTNIPSKYLKEKTAPEGGKIHFAVFSGNVRKEIFSELWSALQRISVEFSDEIDISFWGLDPSQFPKLNCKVYHQPFTYSYDRYLSTLEKSFFHFQICPLNSRKTDCSKSPIKYLEGTVTGAVGIFSNIQPYDQLPDDCCMKVENTAESWYTALVKAVKMSEDERLSIYHRAYQHIYENYITESQVISFATALDSTQLHSKLKSKTICYVIHEAYLGGATLHLFRHAMLLKSLNFNVIFCLPDNYKDVPDFEEYVHQRGVQQVFYLPCRRSVQPVCINEKDKADANVIAQFLKQHNVGLIHAATYFPALGLAAKYLNIPNVATLHQYYPNANGYQNDSNIQIIHSSSNRFANEWEKVFHTPAYRIVCPVDDTFFSHYHENKVEILERIRSKQQINILVSGTLQPRKNQLQAIRATKILRDQGVNVRMTLIGYDTLVPDYVQSCRDEIIQQDLQDYVIIKGFDDAPNKYYDSREEHACQILLCSAEDESMPQTILQAMASGVFVVSTNCGGVSEILKDNYNGIMTNGTNAEALAEGIYRLLIETTPVNLEKMLVNAYDTISAIAKPEFVRSELVYLYLRAFERLPNVNTVQQPVTPVQAAAVAAPVIIQRPTPSNETLPMLTDDSYCVSLGGKNIIGRARNYEIIARKSNIVGLKFMAATLGQPLAGRLQMELSIGGHVIQQETLMLSGGIQEEVVWKFPAIDVCSGTKLNLRLRGIPQTDNTWLCVYEKRKKLNLWNRIVYKLNVPASYQLDGEVIYAKLE